MRDGKWMFGRRSIGKHIAGRAALDAAFGQRTVHPLDDVAALAEFAKRRLGLGLMNVLLVPDLSGEPPDFEGAQPADLERMKFVRLLARLRRGGR